MKSFRSSGLATVLGIAVVMLATSFAYADMQPDKYKRKDFKKNDQVNDVALPASALMLGSGLAVLVLLALRKRRTKTN